MTSIVSTSDRDDNEVDEADCRGVSIGDGQSELPDDDGVDSAVAIFSRTGQRAVTVGDDMVLFVCAEHKGFPCAARVRG